MNCIVLLSVQNYKPFKMKNYILPVLMLFLTGMMNAQERDLSYYLEKAKVNSPLIQKNQNENKIVVLDLKQVKSILSKPEINLEASVLFAPIVSHDNNSTRFEWASDGATNYTGYDLAITDGGQYSGMISLNQPLITGSTYQSFSYKADISRQINENSIALTIHEIERLVSYQYILCIKSEKQSEISLALVKELKTQLQIMQKLVDNAIYKQTDLMLLQIEYQNYEVEQKTFQADYKTNLYDLNLICGINDTNLVENIREINFQLKPDTSAKSQFLTSYKLDSLDILAGQKIFELKYKPQVSLFANAGMNAVYVPAFNRFGFSTGLTFSWNIFDGHQRNTQREISALNIQSIEYDKNYFMLKSAINKNKILNQIKSLDQRIIFSEEQIDQYNTLQNIYFKELSQGEISVMDLKNLLKDIAAKKQENLLMKMEKQILINSYNYWNY